MDIDPELLGRVLKCGKYRTKREAVNTALPEHLGMMLQQQALLNLGTFEFAPGWEDKNVRRAAR